MLKQVGGWTQVYKGLTFVTVRGAGHEVPLHRPKQALVLIKSFLSGSPMPTLSVVEDSWAQPRPWLLQALWTLQALLWLQFEGNARRWQDMWSSFIQRSLNLQLQRET